MVVYLLCTRSHGHAIRFHVTTAMASAADKARSDRFKQYVARRARAMKSNWSCVLAYPRQPARGCCMRGGGVLVDARVCVARVRAWWRGASPRRRSAPAGVSLPVAAWCSLRVAGVGNADARAGCVLPAAAVRRRQNAWRGR
jgi:hypothetical protein